MKPSRIRGLAALATVVAIALALSACGGSSSPSSTTAADNVNATGSSGPAAGAPGGATGAAGAARRSALATCLKKYGVTLPSFGATGASGASGRHFPFGATGASGRPAGGFPGGGGRGFASNPKLAQALQKCGGLGGFGATGRTGAVSTRIRTELTSFVACMKKHGETLPTPNLSGTGSVFGNVSQTTATFKTAYAQCKGILTYLNHPRRPAGATGSTTG